ncbi:hypothetical protein, partial [Acinetobacter baumannii]|uniref:hypothetical protein n=1 Tax=Acinetobacter baumannii TaxID=470 RepID=UPI0028990295
GTIVRRISVFQQKPSPFVVGVVVMSSGLTNGLKRDQFNTLLIDRKERCATYKCSTVYYL